MGIAGSTTYWTLARLKCVFLIFICFSAICFFYAAVVYKNAIIGNASDAENASAIDVVVPFAKVNAMLKHKFLVCMSSMLDHLSSDVRLLRLHIIGDTESMHVAKSVITTTALKLRNRTTTAVIKVTAYDLDTLGALTDVLVGSIKRHFIYKPGAYYSDALFFFSLVLHRLLPVEIGRVVMLDVDLRFRADVAELYAQFDRFDADQLIGIVYEHQPVYKHIFHAYRKQNPATGVGGDLITSSDGFPGFNSGVLLLELNRMRQSKQYARLLEAPVIDELALKYSFRGHLGDQDFFTLIGIENRQLFHVLNCTWNRQLCTWWRDLGYQTVFDLYHECKGQVKIYHGNCNTAIPND